MTLRYIVLTLAIGCLYSCSSARKAQSTTTTDDAYYSDGSQDSGSGYVANDGSDDRVQPASTADNYNQYAYGNDDNGYSPYSTFYDPFWGPGFGMPFYTGFYGGMGFFSNPYYPYGAGFYHTFGYGYYGYPMYYGGFYNPYYPGFGYYYSHYAVASTGGFSSLYMGGTNRVNVLAYNNRHYNNVTTTVAPQAIAHPVNGTISGRMATSIASNKVTTNGFQTYRPTATRTAGNVQPSNNRTFVRQGNTARTTNQQPAQQRTFQQQPVYRPAPSGGGFRGGGGGFGGGGRVGGGGIGRH